MVNLLWAMILSLGFLAVSCEGEKFRSSGSKGSDALSLNCNTRGNQPPQTVFSDFGNNAAIDTTLCPYDLAQSRDNPLQVVFMIDFSGSMASADKVENGQCDRMRAAQVVVQNFLAALADPQAVQFSVISFEARAQILKSNIPGSGFSATNTSDFCGAVKAAKGTSNTNYEAAFQTANQLLSRTPNSDKRIYFLSDGRPGASSTIGNVEDMTAQEVSRQAIKDAVPHIQTMQSLNLSEIYALFLDWQQGSKVNFEIQPFDLMSEITGNPGNVKVVQNSQQLPVIIKELTPQVDKPITADQILIEVRADGFDGKKTFSADPSTFNWNGDPTSPINFKTLPMQLYGRQGQVVRNQVTISARDSRFSSVVFYIDWDQSGQAGMTTPQQ